MPVIQNVFATIYIIAVENPVESVDKFCGKEKENSICPAFYLDHGF